MESLMSNFSEENSPSSKKWLRQNLKQIRQSISSQRHLQASKEACKFIYQQSQAHAFILSFASFGSEIDLWPLNQILAQENRLILPGIINHQIYLYQVNDLETLLTHPWGIREPNPSLCLTIDQALISLALIPGLGFDQRTGHRLGYGKGYYDRLLAKLHLMKTWGIGFKEQAVTDLIFETQDIPLDQIFLF